MLTAVFVVLGALAAWLLIDRWMLQREGRLHRGHAAWTGSGPDRTFHSTGWEETVPPLEAMDVRLEQLRRQSRKRATA